MKLVTWSNSLIFTCEAEWSTSPNMAAFAKRLDTPEVGPGSDLVPLLQ